MKSIANLDEAKQVTAQIVRLDNLMDAALNSPTAWKRTMGCPGSRYLPEWETAMKRLSAWYGVASQTDIEAQADYEATLRA